MNSIGETLEQFATTLQQQVLAYQEAEETGAFKEEMFTRVMVDYLSDAGEIENAEICLHRARGIHISGYALSENGESLDLIVAHNTDTVPPTTVTKTEVDQIFRRLVTFYEKACAGYHLDIEESGAAFDIAQQIYNAVRAELTQIRFLLITDGIVKVAPPQHKDLPGIRANFEIWDIERLYQFVTSGRSGKQSKLIFPKYWVHLSPVCHNLILHLDMLLISLFSPPKHLWIYMDNMAPGFWNVMLDPSYRREVKLTSECVTQSEKNHICFWHLIMDCLLQRKQ